MSDPKGNPILAPDYNLHRNLFEANDSLPIQTRGSGMNMSGYRYAHIQVVPSGGANPTVQVLWWSEEAGKFVQEHTAISKAGVGADTPYEFTVEALGRIMLVAITAGNNTADDRTKVLVAGFEVSPH